MKKRPLVSILIPNYNYARYLEHCFESILAQTYTNYEVIFRDNASTDNSYEIALKYQKKFEKKGIYCSVIRNKRNIGSNANSFLCEREEHGEIRYFLASDDAIAPTFLERTVDIFERYPSVGLVMVNREELDDDNNIHKIAPFYNKDCVIPAESQAAVFMMAGIAIPCQRICRVGIELRSKKMMRSLQVAGDWFYNFFSVCVHDAAYLTDSLCQYRVHGGNETNESEKQLVGVMEHYQLINYFAGMARNVGFYKAAARRDEAVKKLASMCIRYAVKMFFNGLYDIAAKYLAMAPAFDRTILENQDYVKAKIVLDSPETCRKQLAKELLGAYLTERKKSYDPPEDAILI